jgi:hypothetical protein
LEIEGSEAINDHIIVMGRSWTQEEDDRLRELMRRFGRQWSVIAAHMQDRNPTQVAARWEKCLNPNLIKGQFSRDEDETIMDFVKHHGVHAWGKIRSVIPHRTPKQCRERWFNSLNPDVSKDPWTTEEDRIIFDGYQTHGPKWSLIAQSVPGRTDNAIKNRWNASISKRVQVDHDGHEFLIPRKSRKYTRATIRDLPRPPQFGPLPLPLTLGTTTAFTQHKDGDSRGDVEALSVISPALDFDQFDASVFAMDDSSPSPFLTSGSGGTPPLGSDFL